MCNYNPNTLNIDIKENIGNEIGSGVEGVVFKSKKFENEIIIKKSRNKLDIQLIYSKCKNINEFINKICSYINIEDNSYNNVISKNNMRLLIEPLKPIEKKKIFFNERHNVIYYPKLTYTIKKLKSMFLRCDTIIEIKEDYKVNSVILLFKLALMHSINIAHGDLHEENIMCNLSSEEINKIGTFYLIDVDSIDRNYILNLSFVEKPIFYIKEFIYTFRALFFFEEDEFNNKDILYLLLKKLVIEYKQIKSREIELDKFIEIEMNMILEIIEKLEIENNDDIRKICDYINKTYNKIVRDNLVLTIKNKIILNKFFRWTKISNTDIINID